MILALMDKVRTVEETNRISRISKSKSNLRISHGTRDGVANKGVEKRMWVHIEKKSMYAEELRKHML
jgi:hypothetical protein